MRWKTTSSGSNQCAKRHPKEFKKDYQYCEESKLPSTKTITFKTPPCDLGVEWSTYQFKDENPPNDIDTYQTACNGDSGSGQFVESRDELAPKTTNDKSRFALVAVHSRKLHDRFKYKGVKYRLPCGSNTYDHTTTMKYLRAHPVAESITWPSTMRWIKNLAFKGIIIN
jgi:hypothetical protein